MKVLSIIWSVIFYIPFLMDTMCENGITKTKNGSTSVSNSMDCINILFCTLDPDNAQKQQKLFDKNSDPFTYESVIF